MASLTTFFIHFSLTRVFIVAIPTRRRNASVRKGASRSVRIQTKILSRGWWSLKNLRKIRRVSKHHRKPRSLGGKNSRHNISVVQDKLHEAWHLLFDNCSPEGVAHIINTYWIDPQWEMIASRRKKKKEVKGGESGKL